MKAPCYNEHNKWVWVANVKSLIYLDDGIYLSQAKICSGINCGEFVMAYAKHLVLGRPMLFTQSDMWFYRQKTVHDVYNKQ